MAVQKGKIIELNITDIAFGGKGLAKPDGFAVFVDRAVPGDVVRARVTRKKKNYAEARIVDMVRPSPHRVEAPCPYVGWCGGCKWQDVHYDAQLEYKQRHVEDALRHIGLIDKVPVHPTIPSPDLFHYRNKMEFSCSDRRWLLPEEMDHADIDRTFALGLHVPGTFSKVLDTRICYLQPELGNRILEVVRDHMKSSGLPAYGLRSHAGFWRFLVLRHSRAHDQWMVNILTAAENPEAVFPLAEKLRAEFPEVVSVLNGVTARKSGVAVGESTVMLSGGNTIRDRIDTFEFEISANSFFQTNTRGAAVLYDTVRRFADLEGGETVLDLYSGTGTIAIFLAASAASVIGMEMVESAVLDAERNCRLNNIGNCRFVKGDIREALSAITDSPDVMIIDPPRAGMHQDVLKQVLTIAPQKVVYVSCNPATLARDLGVMQETYRVHEVQPVDMFPHTYHIEAVARLSKN